MAHQAPVSMGFSGQEYWSGLPCPPPETLPDPGIEPTSLMSSALVGRFFVCLFVCFYHYRPLGTPGMNVWHRIIVHPIFCYGPT